MLHVRIPILLLVLVALFTACEDDDPTVNVDPVTNDTLGSGRVASPTFGYADTLFFLREQATDYIESTTTALTGTFGAYPDGLSLNPTNGDINVTQSESGVKYEVFYVPTGTTDTSKVNVIISGINYLSGIRVLGQGDTLAVPFYNAQQGLLPPCSDDDDDDDDDGDDDDDDGDDDDDDDDDDDGCEFDDGADDDDGDGTADEPAAGQQVRPQGIEIDTLTGVINLAQTVTNGTFGAVPVNGATKSVRLFYRLNDESNATLNFIDINFRYYNTLADVPQSVRDNIADKNGSLLRKSLHSNERPMLRGRPRPPEIIIVNAL